MGHVYAIILGGGSGLRLGSDTPKQFLPLGGRPMIAWSMAAFHSLEAIDRIVAVVPERHRAEIASIARSYNIDRLYTVLPGGATRQGSARNALDLIEYAGDDILMFHDAARPFVTPALIARCLADARVHGASATYVPVRDTIAHILEGFVSSVPPREMMHHAQTPQAFRYPIIRAAHDGAAPDDPGATDDAGLVLAAGFRVKMTMGDYSNVKITDTVDYRSACRTAEELITG